MFVFCVFIASISLILSTFSSSSSKRVLVIGGSGRVGGSAVRALNKQGFKVDVGGRNIKTWQNYNSQYNNQLPNNFIPVNVYNKEIINDIVKEYDLVINTAGPFQGLKESIALQCCLQNGVKYIGMFISFLSGI